VPGRRAWPIPGCVAAAGVVWGAVIAKGDVSYLGAILNCSVLLMET